MNARFELIKKLRKENPELSLHDAYTLTDSPEYWEELQSTQLAIFNETLEKVTEDIFQNSPLKYADCQTIANCLMMNFKITAF